MVSAKTICAYILYALLATALFLYLLFPDQAVTAYLNSCLAAIDPALSVEATSVRPALPPGLKISGIDLQRDRLRMAHFENARMSPELGSLFKDEKLIRFQARLADGNISGRAVMADSGPTGLLSAEADLARIQLDRLDAVQSIDRFGLSGTLQGHLALDGGQTSMGMINGKLVVAGLRIALKKPFFGITEFVMDQADTEFSFNGRNLRIKALTFGGPLVAGKLSGTIDLREPIGESRLNLSGNAKPQPELFARLQDSIPQGVVNPRTIGTRGLSFSLRGSVDSPTVSMR